jgi:hypothetical protein
MTDSAKKSGFFEVYDQTKMGKVSFQSADLSSEARQTLADTMHTINQLFAREIHEKGFEKAMGLLEQTMFIPPDSEMYDSVFHEEVTREKAEKMLQGRNVGTFFFRKDPFGQILEDELSDKFNEPIRCFTLTALGEHDKVIDFTIVERLGKFQIYNDDPMLEKPYFDSLDELLRTLKHICKFPLRKR